MNTAKEDAYAAALAKAVKLLDTKGAKSEDVLDALRGYHKAKSALIGYDDGWTEPTLKEIAKRHIRPPGLK